MPNRNELADLIAEQKAEVREVRSPRRRATADEPDAPEETEIEVEEEESVAVDEDGRGELEIIDEEYESEEDL